MIFFHEMMEKGILVNIDFCKRKRVLKLLIMPKVLIFFQWDVGEKLNVTLSLKETTNDGYAVSGF